MILSSTRRRLTAAAPAFDITDLALIRYYDADDLVPGGITTWAAHSALGPTLTASGSPTAVAAVKNGHAVARFVAASSQYLNVASGGTSLNGATGFTAAIVYKVTAPAVSAVLFHVGTDACRLSPVPGGALYVVVDETSAAYGYTPALGDDTWIRVIVRYDGGAVGNAARLRIRAQGVDQTLSFSGTVPASIICGDKTEIGRYDSGVYYADGDIPLVALANTCADDTTTDDLDAWLVSRFAL